MICCPQLAIFKELQDQAEFGRAVDIGIAPALIVAFLEEWIYEFMLFWPWPTSAASAAAQDGS